MTHSREVIFESVGNARDIGGISIGEQKIKSGRLLRCASLYQITQGDIEKLQKEYSPAYIVDFRMKYEVEQSPDPEIPGTTNYSFPVLEPEDIPGFKTDYIIDGVKNGESRIQKFIKLTQNRLPDERIYILFLKSDRGKKAYRDFFDLLLDLPEGRGIVWHCKDGKDRTGIAAMLLLSALGASREVIMEDYLLTNKQNEKLLSEIRTELEEADISQQQKEAILFLAGGVQEQFILAAMRWLDETYGGAAQYLASECMVDQASIKKLKDKFLVNS